MKTMLFDNVIRIIIFFSLFILSLMLSNAQDTKKLTITEMEKNLFEMVNSVRSQHGKSKLYWSYHLQTLAKNHSQDMAQQNAITHISSSGTTYTNRLSDAKLIFMEHGENVAFSESYVVDFIHQSFMDSPEHKANILDPRYNIVGIGIFFQEGRGFYITQDFLHIQGNREPTVETPETIAALLSHIKQDTRSAINAFKTERSLPAFVFLEQADVIAQEYSLRKAQNLSLPDLPEELKRIHNLMIFYTAPSLDSILDKLSFFQNRYYDKGGLGIAYARNKSYPGGAFYFTFLLLLDKDYKSLPYKEHINRWAKNINSQRKRRKLESIEVDIELSKVAFYISVGVSSGFKRDRLIPIQLRRYQISTFSTKDTNNLPTEIQSSLLKADISSIGFGMFLEENPDSPEEKFWISIIFK